MEMSMDRSPALVQEIDGLISGNAGQVVTAAEALQADAAGYTGGGV